MSPRAHAPGDAATRTYRLLLRAYPAAFRAAYGREMVQLFRDQWRDARPHPAAGARAGFWAAVLWDVARSAPALQFDALRARWRAWRHGPRLGGPHLQPVVSSMTTATRTVAVLAVLGGAFEVANTGVAFWGAGHPPRGADEGLAVLLGVLLGVLLAIAGTAVLRGAPGAPRVARGAALGCLVLMAALQLWFPFMSIFARLLGVVLPVALLIVTRRTPGAPGRDSSVRAVA